MSAVEPLDIEELKIVPIVDEAASVVTCIWRGKSTLRYPGRILEPWFEKLLNVSSSEQLAVRMRFDELVHFNSSTIGAIVQFIHRARSHGVHLALVYSNDQRWQRISFQALRVFVKKDGLVALEPVTDADDPAPAG